MSRRAAAISWSAAVPPRSPCAPCSSKTGSLLTVPILFQVLLDASAFLCRGLGLPETVPIELGLGIVRHPGANPLELGLGDLEPAQFDIEAGVVPHDRQD